MIMNYSIGTAWAVSHHDMIYLLPFEKYINNCFIKIAVIITTQIFLIPT